MSGSVGRYPISKVRFPSIRDEIPESDVGATAELNLRVSVAALARVLLAHPESGENLLVLERTATLQERVGAPQVIVRAKPYGGGVRLRDVDALRAAIGEFQFDSARSREEADFRILIRGADWPQVQAFCLRELRAGIRGFGEDSSEDSLLMPFDAGLVEASPERELIEELEDSLKIGRLPDQPWTLTPLGVVVEALPAPSTSSRAPGVPTVRVYSVHEARLRSTVLIAAVLANSVAFPGDEDLARLAWEDRHRGGKGRANAALALPLDALVNAYRSAPIEARGSPLQFGGHLLDGNVPAILPEVETRKYQWNRGNTNWPTGASS